MRCVYMCVCVCVCVCVRARARARVRVCICMRARTHECACIQLAKKGTQVRVTAFFYITEEKYDSWLSV